MSRITSEKGLLSLEASISVTIFIFYMLFLYSFFVVFEARNEIAHVLLATTDSMSLDVYENEKLGNSGSMASVLYQFYGYVEPNEEGFVSSEQWNKVLKDDVEGVWNGTIYAMQTTENPAITEEDDYGKKAQISSVFSDTLRERFVAYLSGGDEEEANDILERYHIVGGINGLDFSNSHIASGKIYVSVRYTIEYEYNLFGLGQLELEQSSCSKIWQ